MNVIKDFIQKNLWFLIPTLLFIFFGILVLLLTEPLESIFFVGAYHNTFFDYFFAYITKAGETYMYMFLTLPFIPIDRKTALSVGLGGIFILIFSAFLKWIFQFPRPYYVLWKLGRLDELPVVSISPPIESGVTSFPSGHTMSAFFLYGLLAFTMKSNTAKFFLFCVAALIGFSRVYLACHFPMDVTAGAFVGTSVGMTAYLVFHQDKTISD